MRSKRKTSAPATHMSRRVQGNQLGRSAQPFPVLGCHSGPSGLFFPVAQQPGCPIAFSARPSWRLSDSTSARTCNGSSLLITSGPATKTVLPVQWSQPFLFRLCPGSTQNSTGSKYWAAGHFFGTQATHHSAARVP